MNKIKKYLVSILSVALLIVSLAGCGSKSPSDLIVGQWEIPEEVENARTTTALVQLEFFSDGTYTSNLSNYSGDYSIDGDRIKLNGVLVEPLTVTFGLEEDTLTFYYDDGEVLDEYQRVE